MCVCAYLCAYVGGIVPSFLFLILARPTGTNKATSQPRDCTRSRSPSLSSAAPGVFLSSLITITKLRQGAVHSSKVSGARRNSGCRLHPAASPEPLSSVPSSVTSLRRIHFQVPHPAEPPTAREYLPLTIPTVHCPSAVNRPLALTPALHCTRTLHSHQPSLLPLPPPLPLPLPHFSQLRPLLSSKPSLPHSSLSGSSVSLASHRMHLVRPSPAHEPSSAPS
ncbi:hypothetical protein BKA56DRAFT_222211 [Ilyonectria sp. MPI-CAGE-AT-0026]|nr:hypothetical protein BKA56DRAFT_222211 [Ilyonectria sp. MPI-CAGE-AT-0026]